MSKIVEWIERESGVPGLVSILAERLSPTDLQSLLLEVYRQRSCRRHASEVLAQSQTDRFVHPALLSPKRLLAWEQIAFSDDHRTSGRGYYRDLRFHIHATHLSGQRLQLVDGGSVDWTQPSWAMRKSA